MLLFFRNETGFGGNNGFTDFKRILGFTTSPRPRCAALFALSAAAADAWCWALPGVTSKFGRVLAAIRDARAGSCSSATTRCTTSCSSGRCRRCCAALAGALRAPGGHHQPLRDVAANSIEIAIWVAVGGRGTLVGPVIGAFIVNLAKSWFTVEFPNTGCSSWASCSSA